MYNWAYYEGNFKGQILEIQITNFLNILRTIFDDEKELSLLEPVDWNLLSKMARKQNILPLFFEAASGIEGYVSASVYAKDQLDTFAMVAAQIQRSCAFADVYEKLTQQGIYPIVMKGIICRQLYGELGEHRPSGDEDILVEIKDFHKVQEILEREGYVCDFSDVTKKQLTQLQEVSFRNSEQKLTLEVHTNIIGKENDERAKMNAFFENVHARGQMVGVYGTEFKTLEPTDALLFLILHAYKHFQNRGVGIRQAMDILLYYKEHKNKISMEYLRSALKTCKAESFWMDILYIGKNYLGLTKEEPEFTCCPDALLQDMMYAGVFGKDGKMDHVAARVNLGAQDSSHRLLKALFPSKEILVGGRPYLAEKPWLLPVVWMERWIKFLRYAGKDVWHISREILDKSSVRMDMIKKYRK